MKEASSMERTLRILDRFPHFYKTWDNDSLIYRIVVALGKRLDESDNELTRILRGHWVDTANIHDLDNMGNLYNVKRKPGEPDDLFRSRLKRTIIEYKGGGTINAILNSVRMTLGLPNDYPLELVENPPAEVSKEFMVNPGDTWRFSGESVQDATPTIEISLVTEGERITDPRIINLDTGEEVAYKGIVQQDEVLTITEDGARLNRKNVSKNLSPSKPPTIPRKETAWTYREPISEEIGVFDTAIFDESKFAIGIQTVRLGFKWISHQPATFEINIPRKALRDDDDLEIVKESVDSIKATGVNAIIKVVE